MLGVHCHVRHGCDLALPHAPHAHPAVGRAGRVDDVGKVLERRMLCTSSEIVVRRALQRHCNVGTLHLLGFLLEPLRCCLYWPGPPKAPFSPAKSSSRGLVLNRCCSHPIHRRPRYQASWRSRTSTSGRTGMYGQPAGVSNEDLVKRSAGLLSLY